jgi:hypothetical protein
LHLCVPLELTSAARATSLPVICFAAVHLPAHQLHHVHSQELHTPPPCGHVVSQVQFDERRGASPAEPTNLAPEIKIPGPAPKISGLIFSLDSSRSPQIMPPSRRQTPAMPSASPATTPATSSVSSVAAPATPNSSAMVTRATPKPAPSSPSPAAVPATPRSKGSSSATTRAVAPPVASPSSPAAYDIACPLIIRSSSSLGCVLARIQIPCPDRCLCLVNVASPVNSVGGVYC